MEYGCARSGEPNTREFELSCTLRGNSISYWHDVPLIADAEKDLYNMVVEVPKGTTAKMEVMTDDTITPIRQDVKKGKLRHYPTPMPWNYGMFPRTWENPNHENVIEGVDGWRGDMEEFAPAEKFCGDGDPLDVIEIGGQPLEMGGVYSVKPLGVFAMIDDGELDWKVIAVRADCTWLNDIDDVKRVMPGELRRIREWFRDYKIPAGKPPARFGYAGQALDKEQAMSVIEETHWFYLKR